VRNTSSEVNFEVEEVERFLADLEDKAPYGPY
jgi:hypothetical protein